MYGTDEMDVKRVWKEQFENLFHIDNDDVGRINLRSGLMM